MTRPRTLSETVFRRIAHVPGASIPSCALLTETLLSFLLSSLPDVYAQRPRDQRPPVSWANSDLPSGPGLTHHVLASKAMGQPEKVIVT